MNTKTEPKRLTSRDWRRRARSTRDAQWAFMEKIAALGVLWFCCWNKLGKPELADEVRTSLFGGMALNDWMFRHRAWFRIGRWNEERYASPIRLKPAGRRALRQRWRYDLEPVFGGMVEPGWQAIPEPRRTSP